MNNESTDKSDKVDQDDVLYCFVS